MFRTVPLSIIRSSSLYTQQWYMAYRFADSLRAGSVPSWSCSQAVSKPVWHIPLLCVQWKTPDNGQRNYPKHVEFHSKNKFEKLMHLVGFIIRNLARSHERQILPNLSFSSVSAFSIVPIVQIISQSSTQFWGTLYTRPKEKNLTHFHILFVSCQHFILLC